jgi:methionyl-tRNA formyltransferase
LESLASAGKYEILVGVDGVHGGGAFHQLKRVWKRHGTIGVLRRVLAIYRASKQRKRLDKHSTGGCLSLREVMMVHQLEGFEAAPINAGASVARIEQFRPDLITVANFSQIIRPGLLSAASLGVINLHPSLLPKYRGPMPFFWVLKNGETRSGVTVHFVDEGVDTGDIILQAEVEVKANDTEASLRQRSIAIGAPLLVEAVESVLDGSATRTPQNESEMSYDGFPPRGASRL